MLSAGGVDGRLLRAAADAVFPPPQPLLLGTNIVSPTAAAPPRLPCLDGHTGDVPPSPNRRGVRCAGAVLLLLLLYLHPAAVAVVAEKEKASTDRPPPPTQSKAEAVAAALATRLATLADRNRLRRLMTLSVEQTIVFQVVLARCWGSSAKVPVA